MKIKNYFFLGLFFVSSLLMAQEKKISGTIKGEDGLPLLGVNIVIDNTSKGTQTDFDGTTNELAILRLKNEGEQAFSLYPNPTQDFLQLHGIGAKAVIDIYSSNGNLFMHSEVDLPNAIDLSSLQSGVYFLKITSENGVGESHRILKVD